MTRNRSVPFSRDNLYRKRDPRFKDAERHVPRRPDAPFAKPKRNLLFQPKDFQLAQDHSHAICPAGKRMYKSGKHRDLNSRRLGTVEPVFGNICHTHRLNRFSLRGRKKVNAQWLRFCLVHNIGKVQRLWCARDDEEDQKKESGMKNRDPQSFIDRIDLRSPGSGKIALLTAVQNWLFLQSR
jgi:hypothetical protein